MRIDAAVDHRDRDAAAGDAVLRPRGRRLDGERPRAGDERSAGLRVELRVERRVGEDVGDVVVVREGDQPGATDLRRRAADDAQRAPRTPAGLLDGLARTIDGSRLLTGVDALAIRGTLHDDVEEGRRVRLRLSEERGIDSLERLRGRRVGDRRPRCLRERDGHHHRARPVHDPTARTKPPIHDHAPPVITLKRNAPLASVSNDPFAAPRVSAADRRCPFCERRPCLIRRCDDLVRTAYEGVRNSRGGVAYVVGLHTLTEAANVALALSILALTVSSLRSGGRPSRGRSWLFFAGASVTLVVHAVLDALEIGRGDIADVFQVATAALLGTGFVYLYGADRDELRRLQAAAERDPMTQLYNVRTFRALAEARIVTAGERALLAIAVLDLDGFKRVNDTHGHPAGDRALGLVATAVRASLRASDIAARYGGDEFILLLNECDDAAAERIVQRIRRTVAALSMGIGEPLSVSAGVATYPSFGPNLDELIARADDALLDAKRAGKNDVRHALAPERA
ncbi:MAG: GGDEF domain-containing protein [Chloroflexi bacterium]|nr:MAG: GGDEF domain-containing protein [Chloroflexota bacterium]